jgi:hypothetical protein
MKAAVWLELARPRSALPATRARPRDDRGSLTLPLALMLVAGTFMSFGTWGLMRRWRHLTELQDRLDRCVGETALELRGSLTRIEDANRRMAELRAAQAIAAASGLAGETLAALEVQASLQDLELLRWKARQARWLAERGCDRVQDLPVPLPEMGWFRPPPDPLGPQPLRWQPGVPRDLKIGLFHSPRAAAARVSADGAAMPGLRIGGFGSERWKAAWTVPGSVGPSID